MDEIPEHYQVGAPPPAPVDEPAPVRPRKPRRTGLFVALVAAAAVVVLAGGGVLVWVLLTKTGAGEAIAEATAPPFEAAKKKCAPGNVHVQIGDNGKTLTLQSEGEEDAGISYAQLQCFFGELELTDAVKAEVGQTRALDGKQTGEWGSYRASWRYHPDSGLNMVVTMR